MPAHTSTQDQINQWFDDYYWLPIRNETNHIIGWKYEPTECELILPEQPTIGQILSIGALAGIERTKATHTKERHRPAFVRH